MIEAIENKSATPLCPHCDAPQRNIHFQEVRSILGRRYLYFCASCVKVLGVSHRKGFWMG